jgi:type II secretory pathway pseudopilin PulG
MNSPAMTSRRRGKSLIEMLILISLTSVVLGIVSTTLVALFKTDRQVRRDLVQLTTLARLGSRFRTDAHAARSCQIDKTCDLTLADGRLIRYSFEGQRLSREVRRGDAIEHRDAFVLPDTAAVGFDKPATHGGRLVRLSITAQERSDKPYLTAVRPATIDAAVGLSTITQEAAP